MFSESLSDLQLISYARKNGTNNFFKKAKNALKDILLCCLFKKRLLQHLNSGTILRKKGNYLTNVHYQRWEIEKKYHILINKMRFESVARKASVYVYQNFGVQVLVYNIKDIRNSADGETAVTERENGSKYPIHTNESMTIGLSKRLYWSFFWN